MSGKSQTIGDFTFCQPSQILPIYLIFTEVCPRFSRDAMFLCDRGTGAQLFRGLVLSEIHRRRPQGTNLSFQSLPILQICPCSSRRIGDIYDFQFSLVGKSWDGRETVKSQTDSDFPDIWKPGFWLWSAWEAVEFPTHQCSSRLFTNLSTEVTSSTRDKAGFCIKLVFQWARNVTSLLLFLPSALCLSRWPPSVIELGKNAFISGIEAMTSWNAETLSFCFFNIKVISSISSCCRQSLPFNLLELSKLDEFGGGLTIL